MSVYFGGSKAKELYFQGRKIREAWYEGRKVYVTESSGKPVEVIPGDLSKYAVAGWLKDKLTEYGEDYATVTELPFDLDTRHASGLVQLFRGYVSLTSVPPMNTSNVTDMSGMFAQCQSLTSVPPMDTSNVTDMSGMFSVCQSLASLPDLDASKATDTRNMFMWSHQLTDGSVCLIREDGTKPPSRDDMIKYSGLTREPFFTPDGKPID